MKVKHHIFELELEHTFRISRSANDTQRTLIIEVNQDGITGYGEATENPYYGVTIEGMVERLKSIHPLIDSFDNLSLDQTLDLLESELKDDSFLLCALDLALHDWFAQKAGLPLFRFWNLEWNNLPITNYTIGIDTVDRMVEKLKMQPWPLYKIKLGIKEDVEIIKALRKETDAIFRIDANCGWTAEETVQKAPILKSLGVEFIEQPLPAEDWEGMEYVFQNSVLPVIADESCQVETDVAKCIGYFHGINIKVVKCGGLRPALRMIKMARANNLQLMVGCMTESSIGISAIAHLLPLLDYARYGWSFIIEKRYCQRSFYTEWAGFS